MPSIQEAQHAPVPSRSISCCWDSAHLPDGGGEQIRQLACGGIERHLMEEVHELRIVLTAGEVLGEQPVDERVQHERIVDGDHTHTLVAVPARLPTPRDGVVHDVVRHQEHALQPLHAPVHTISALSSSTTLRSRASSVVLEARSAGGAAWCVCGRRSTLPAQRAI